MQARTDRRRVGRALVVVVAAWVMVVGNGGIAGAAPGDLDTTFDGDGMVTTTFPGGAFARAVAIQPDGKLVVVGAAAGDSEEGEFAVARYLDDGTLDDTFATAGQLTTPVGPDGGAEARAVALQTNGKVVVAGTSDRERFAVARFRSDGTLDPRFGGDGIVRTNLSRGDDIGYAMAIQPNGRIVVAGSAGTRRPAFALVRYRSDGSRDPRFGDDGVVITPFGIWGVIRAIVLQPDGRIVVAGMNGAGFALARYRPNGRLDPTFGFDGKVTGPSFGSGSAFAVALQPDGKIVAGGAYDFFRFAIARYRPNGRLDRTFGGDGRVVTDVGGAEQGVIGLVIQDTGSVVAVGHAGPHEFPDPQLWRFVLTRYDASGVQDTTFGTDGMVVTDFGEGAFASGSAAQEDGKVVVVGGAGDSQDDAFALARYLL